MSTTTNRPTPATATKLHAMLDEMLSPTRATTPELPTTAPSTTSLIDDMSAIVRRIQVRPQPPRTAPGAASAATLTETTHNRANDTNQDGTLVHNVSLCEGLNVPLKVYPWDPMPTSDDPCGLRERTDKLDAAIAARVARSDPRPAPATPTMSSLTEARLIKAHLRLDEILG